jgi:hypothetical protein
LSLFLPDDLPTVRTTDLRCYRDPAIYFLTGRCDGKLFDLSKSFTNPLQILYKHWFALMDSGGDSKALAFIDASGLS